MEKQTVPKCTNDINNSGKDRSRNNKKKVIINDNKNKCNQFHSLHKSIYNMKHPQRIKRHQIKHYKSPTDQLLSPCSRKLDNYRSKYIAAKSTPMKLSFSSGSE